MEMLKFIELSGQKIPGTKVSDRLTWSEQHVMKMLAISIVHENRKVFASNSSDGHVAEMSWDEHMIDRRGMKKREEKR